MSKRLVTFNLPTIKSTSIGRRRRRVNRGTESDDKFKSSSSLLKTAYKLSESSYREYGVRQGLLPEHLANPESFILDSTNLYSELDSCNVYNIGSIVPCNVDELFNTLPEGLCGDMIRDIALLPEGQPLGLINRKASLEIISQLKQYGRGNEIKSRGWLLDGKRGCGKSYVLNHVALWARRNGWLVILEPTPSKYSKEIGSIKRSNSGVYIQVEFARAFLERLLAGNENNLMDIPVIHSLYGKIALDGNYVNYNKRMFDTLIRKIVDEELEMLKEEQQIKLDDIECFKESLKLWHSYRQEFKIPILKQRLENPQTLLDIAKFGIENDTFATQAIYEIFNQLKHQRKYPLLIIVDEYNECFPVSEYLSIKYEGTKYGGWIPSYHLCMPRLFYKFDGAEYKRGLKLLSTSWRYNSRRDYKPQYLGILPNEIKTIRNFTMKEYASYIHNLQNNQVLFNFPSDKTNYYYMLTGGNGFESRRLLAKLY